MDYPSAHVLEYRSYWLSISVVLTLNDNLGGSIFFPGENNERWNIALNVVNFSILSQFVNIESYHSSWRGLLTTSPMWSGIGGFVGRLMSLFPMVSMCLIWLNMDLFSWIFSLKIFLPLCYVTTWILLYLTLICWLDMASVTCCTDVGYFLPILIIHTLVLFILGSSLFYGIFFTEIHSTCCDAHIIGKGYQRE